MTNLATTPKLTILNPLDTVKLGMANEEDRELLQLQLIGTTPTNTNFKIMMTLCSGPKDSQPYMLFSFRTLYQQQLVEFFVNKDLSAADPLPYLPHEYSSSFSNLHFVPVCLKEALEFEHLVTLSQKPVCLALWKKKHPIKWLDSMHLYLHSLRTYKV